jgi:hypothetical protein
MHSLDSGFAARFHGTSRLTAGKGMNMNSKMNEKDFGVQDLESVRLFAQMYPS